MKNPNKLPISTLLFGKAHFVELLFTAIFIGFGISIMASSITLIKSFNPLYGTLTGIIICFVGVTFIFFRMYKREHETYSFDAFLIIDENENKVLAINEYKFSEDIEYYFKSAFAENKALEYIWKTEPLKLQDESKSPEVGAISLIREAIEYFLLDKLSTHLLSYFKFPAEHKKNVAVIERTNVPSVLLKNRFFELFSKPLEDREHFIGYKDILSEDEETYILEVGDASYRKFVFVLPQKSKVERYDDSTIEIDTKRFIFKWKVIFDGCNTNLPSGFLEHYLSIKGFEGFISNVAYRVKVDVSVKFKARAFLHHLDGKTTIGLILFLEL